jgi:hypothetical protein
MNFSEVQQSVQQAWEFTWPPVVLLVIMIALVRLLAPASYVAFQRRLSLELPSRWARVQAFLHHYGFAKLLPVAVLFMIVFTLFLTNSVLHLAGNSIPPRISYRPDIIFARAVDEKQLACLWSFFPWADVGSLQSIVNKRVEAEDKVDDDVQNWREARDRAYRRFNAAKFLTVWALFWGIAERRRGRIRSGRLAVALAVLASMVVIYLFGFLYALDQLQHAQKNAAIALWINKKSCIDAAGHPLSLTSEQTEQWLRKKTEGEAWRVHPPLEEYWRWIRRPI